MYSIPQIVRGLNRGVSNPAYFGRELNRIFHRRFYRREFNTAGVDVMAEDWDTLVILDACRYDMFAEVHDLPGKLERRQSRASHTHEFLRANVDGRDLQDTVYVTASPQLYRWRHQIDAQFHAVINVWRDDGWDEQYATVLPETMGEYVRRAADEYPRKRLIAHFLQPHYPFIRSGQELNTGRLRHGDGTDLWGELMTGDTKISADTLWEAIRDNLDAVLPTVRSLLEYIDGRTVVTSDHGNMTGERAWPVPIREWGHPPSVYTDQLLTVPWLIHESGERREIVYEAVDERQEDIDDTIVEQRLEHLGYA